ncbi:MAG: TIR domain-containing protein [Chloroflexota bacterium]|nr:TIR domain-containing protein [Chloroflexota bacterium]
MPDIFLSYSRHNIDFARRLVEALNLSGRDSWVDWDDIPQSAAWWQSIREGIESTQAFVFLITPHSLASPVCTMELAHALANGKRVIPVVHVEGAVTDAFGKLAGFRPTGFLADVLAGRDILDMARKNWSVVEGINWLFCRETDDFDAAFKRLLQTAETDLSHLRLHTRLLVRANEWRERAYSKSYLLYGADLTEASNWMKVNAEKMPLITEAHKAFIRASHHQEEEEEAARQGQIASLDAASRRASDEARKASDAAARAARQQRARNIATVIAVVVGTIAVLIGVTAANRVAEAGETEGRALANVETATRAQGDALNDAALARQQAIDIGMTVTPILITMTSFPPTLTQAEFYRADSEKVRRILDELSAALLNIDNGFEIEAQIARMDRLVEGLAGDAVALRARGTVLARVGQTDQALDDFDAAVEANPQYADALISRGALLYNLGEFERAERDFTGAIRLQDDRALTFYNRGLALAAQEDFIQARLDFNNAIALQPGAGYAEAFRARGFTAYQLEDYASASRDLQQAFDLGLRDPDTIQTLNQALGASGEATLTLTPSPTGSSTPTRTAPPRPVFVPPTATVATLLPFLDETLDVFSSNRSAATDDATLLPDDATATLDPTLTPFDTPIPFDTPLPFETEVPFPVDTDVATPRPTITLTRTPRPTATGSPVRPPTATPFFAPTETIDPGGFTAP